ncbi:MAG: hypothetical protein NVS3B3_18640 [Aquirhabdus sp.]
MIKRYTATCQYGDHDFPEAVMEESSNGKYVLLSDLEWTDEEIDNCWNSLPGLDVIKDSDPETWNRDLHRAFALALLKGKA